MQRSAEVRVGVFVVVVLLLGVFVFNSLTPGGGAGAHGYDFEIWFDSAPGVGQGSPVRLAGVEIGEVIDKDIIEVHERVQVEPSATGGLFPFAQVTTWDSGDQRSPEFARVEVQRKGISTLEARSMDSVVTSRLRRVARLNVRVKGKYELYTQYSYTITGGVVFGDKMLNVSEFGPAGRPLTEKERGDPISTLRDKGTRVAVCGQGPPSLDQVVGNVQEVMDQEMAERLKRIATNIERDTDEVAEILHLMRTTIKANQDNASKFMGNIASASEDLRQGMAEMRALTVQTLDRLERAAAVGQRVAENNESRINRMARNLESSSGSLQRMAEGSEGKLDSTMTDVAALAHELRETMAANREKFDHIADRLAATADDVKGITGDSRDQLKSMLDHLNQTVGDLHNLFAESDDKLKGIVDDTHRMVASARDTMDSVHRSIGPLTENLRTSSDNIAAASGNIRELTGDPALRQTLGNFERMSAEGTELMRDLRGMTSDPALQDDVRATVHSLRSSSERLEHTLSSASSYKPSFSADVYYIPDRSDWQSDLNLSVTTKGKLSYHVGADNVTRDPVLNAQLGRSLLGQDMTFRYGFYRSKLGVGADYRLSPTMRVRTDYYDFEDPHFNARFYYRLPMGLTGQVGIEDAFDQFDWTFGVQLGNKSF
jgi:ABC-type transporter Mla subunit MlaD